jgi:hypothetical protein
LPLALLEGFADQEIVDNQFQRAQVHLSAFCQVCFFPSFLRVAALAISSITFRFFFPLCRVTENCKANSMDSKNLAICWWPTLLPYEFTDMVRFEMMRPHLEETVQAMIDQFPFLFLGKDEIVMV